jgi:hypothetical protein
MLRVYILEFILLSHLRERFWMLGERRCLRRVISKCIMWKRHKVLIVEVDPGILPEDQIRDALVFGVNLAGPLILMVDKRHGMNSLHV